MSETVDYYPEIREHTETTTWGAIGYIGHRIYQWAPMRPPASTEFGPVEYFSAEIVHQSIKWWDGNPSNQWLEVDAKDHVLYFKLHCSDRLLVYRLDDTDIEHNIYRGVWPD